MMQCDNLMIILLSSPISVLTFLQLNQYMFRINDQIKKNPEIMSPWRPHRLYGVDRRLKSVEFVFDWCKALAVRAPMDQTQMAYHEILLLNDFY